MTKPCLLQSAALAASSAPIGDGEIEELEVRLEALRERMSPRDVPPNDTDSYDEGYLDGQVEETDKLLPLLRRLRAKLGEVEKERDRLEIENNVARAFLAAPAIGPGSLELERLEDELSLSQAALAKAEKERDEALHGLEESVKLQSHYAGLLNQWDGGNRLPFADAKAWLDRLEALRKQTERT